MPSAGVAQLAEHNVANVVVVGSNPITRSFSLPQVSGGLEALRLFFAFVVRCLCDVCSPGRRFLPSRLIQTPPFIWIAGYDLRY